MFTKVARQMMRSYAAQSTGQNNANNNVAMFPNESIRNVLNQERWVAYSTGLLFSSYNPTLSNNQGGFVVGSGTTPASVDDYKLENQITSGLTMTLVSIIRYVNSAGKPTLELKYTITNNLNDTVTISELGMVTFNVFCVNSSSSTSGGNNNCLVDRTLLDVPVTIAPRASASIVYTISGDMTFA